MRHRRAERLGALVLVLAVLSGCDRQPPARADAPNVILVVTDDQSLGSLAGRPIAMPWLADRLREPGWTTFTNAIVTTPMCCPSRASILTGRYARTTGVRTNTDGEALDESDTLAVWLHDAGYRTAMIGKYLNGYPWDRGPYVPPGWDRWFAKLNLTQATTYFGYEVVDDGERLTIGREPADYATDRLAAEALAFVRSTPLDRPFFLYLAFSAPHFPWTPAPRHEGLVERFRARAPALPPEAAAERVALRPVDEALAALWAAVADRGQLDRTVVLLISDNGYAYGEHGAVGKGCPWRACLEVPFVAYVPDTAGGASDVLAANIDVAPTILELAGLPPRPGDGVSLAPVLRGGPEPSRRGVLIEWAGPSPPGWVGVRLAHTVYVRWDDGRRTLFRLDRDPQERRNLAFDPRAARLVARAEAVLAAVGGPG
ncbi:MAG: hypothetical protein KatS3mg013_1767 [Actinomycetota bacterium]|jgi:arylsulfatase A-like enzyme|nr:MAG: hypothetical protein KatS3mg013_1767 [Actinomycetota bacterium]